MNMSGHGDSFWFVHFHPFFRNISSENIFFEVHCCIHCFVSCFSLFFGTSTLLFFIVLITVFSFDVALCGSFMFGSVSLRFYAFLQLCPYFVHVYICTHVYRDTHAHICFCFLISFADMFQGKH